MLAIYNIDPTVIIDDNGQAYLFWGSTHCNYAKLKANMIEVDGPMNTIGLPGLAEVPWIDKHIDKYDWAIVNGE